MMNQLSLMHSEAYNEVTNRSYSAGVAVAGGTGAALCGVSG